MNKIIIIDDHRLLSDLLTESINNEKNFEVVGVDTDAKNSLILCKDVNPDLVLMDICTENNSNGIYYAGIIKKEFPNIKIVIMTGASDINFINQAKKSKVDSFVYKTITKDSLISVLKNTLEGYSMYPETTMNLMNKKNILSQLTTKELQVLYLYCKLLNRRDVAETIGVSERTLKNYIASIYEKTGYNDLAKLAIYCVGNNLIIPNLKDI